MVDTKLFNFTVFKSALEIQDIDEQTYSFILRQVFSHINKVYGVDLDAVLATEISAVSTATEITIPYTTAITVDQLVRIGTDEVFVVSEVSDEVANTTVITVNPALSAAPVVATPVTIVLTVVPFDLQYAIYQHAKFLFETQKRNANIIDSATDATGNKVTYKAKIPSLITSTYLEYSPNAVAFID